MRLFTKHQGYYVKHYWIARGDRKVLGWFAGSAYATELGFPPGSKVDIHFTYPRDGGLHFSLKYREPNSGVEHYYYVFKDRIRRKILSGEERTIQEQPRGEGEDLFTWLMPHVNPEPLLSSYSSSPMSFQLPVQALSVRNGEVYTVESERIGLEEAKLTEEDLVVDVALLPDGELNLYALLRGKDSVVPRPSSWYFVTRNNDEAWPVVELIACLIPQEESLAAS